MQENERQLSILSNIKKNIGVSVTDLSKKFKVTSNTIRRDLKILEEKNIIKRIHGGAVMSDLASYDLPFEKREIDYEEEKEAIGRAASQMIEEGDKIILDAGTTCLALARHIKNMKNITVLTNSIATATILEDNPDIVVILSGGMLKGITRSLFGPPAEEFFEVLNADKLFLASGSISLIDNTLYNPNIHEISIKKKMIEAVNEVILLADHHKFTNRALYPFANMSVLDRIVTDEKITKEMKSRIEEKNIDLVVCGIENINKTI